MLLDKPEQFQSEILDEIEDILSTPTPRGSISEMSYKERCFLNGIIRQSKPKKILELGVSAGGSSASFLTQLRILTLVYILWITAQNGIGMKTSPRAILLMSAFLI